MIKVCHINFEEINADNHWVKFFEFGKVLSYSIDMFTDYRSMEVDLDKSKNWQLALDQSTTCSGVFIKDYTNTEVYMIEVKRDSNQTADSYMFDFEMFLHKLFENRIVTHLIYERPINTESYKSSRILFQLEGIIVQLPRRYEEFRATRIDNIANASWRKAVIIDEYARGNRKYATTKSVHRLQDWTNLYGESINSDQDVFEAFGIMFGWFFYSYDTLGRPYVRGDKYNGVIGGFILPFIGAKEVAEKFKAEGIESLWYVEHPNKSLYENLACAVEKYKVVCIELTNSYDMLALSIECNIKWMNPEVMTVVLIAANHVDSRVFKITGDSYHFVI